MFFPSRHYGVSKGSKRFPFREIIVDPDALGKEEAQSEYDFLMKRHQKIVRAMTRDIRELNIQHEHELTDDLLSCREQLRNIEARLRFITERFPEVVR